MLSLSVLMRSKLHSRVPPSVRSPLPEESADGEESVGGEDGGGGGGGGDGGEGGGGGGGGGGGQRKAATSQVTEKGQPGCFEMLRTKAIEWRLIRSDRIISSGDI